MACYIFVNYQTYHINFNITFITKYTGSTYLSKNQCPLIAIVEHHLILCDIEKNNFLDAQK